MQMKTVRSILIRYAKLIEPSVKYAQFTVCRLFVQINLIDFAKTKIPPSNDGVSTAIHKTPWLSTNTL